MKVVSDASPIINIACIDKLNLLNQLYGELYIPEAVWNEVVVQGKGQPGADEIESAKWIKVQSVNDTSLVHALEQELDQGESEAIVLSLEIQAELLLMDERIGREVARHLGLHFSGLIGILIESKSKGLISAIKPNLDALRNIAGFHISNALNARVLKDAGEE